MRPIRVIQSGVGDSVPIPLDTHLDPCNVGLGLTFDGTATATVKHTFDDVFAPDFDPATATWFNHPDLIDVTANVDANYAFYPVALMLSVTAGAGDVTLTVIQAGLG